MQASRALCRAVIRVALSRVGEKGKEWDARRMTKASPQGQQINVLPERERGQLTEKKCISIRSSISLRILPPAELCELASYLVSASFLLVLSSNYNPGVSRLSSFKRPIVHTQLPSAGKLGLLVLSHTPSIRRRWV